MARIYSETNRIRFLDIPEKYAIPRGFRSKQCEVHTAVITYVYEHYRNTKKYRQQVVDALNRLTFYVMQNEAPPFSWISTDPIDTMPTDIDMDTVEDSISSFFLTPEAIIWDIPDKSSAENTDSLLQSTSKLSVSISSKTETESKPKPVQKLNNVVTPQSAKPQNSKSKIQNHPLRQAKSEQKSPINSSVPTPKEDLYIQPPRCPRFDISKVWMSANVNGDELVIYTTLPEIPTRQNEISVTTNLDMMTESELINLYPNHVIHTRAPQMYEQYPNVEYDEDIGCIIPINGFTSEQVKDNIIRYPHLYRLRKIGPDGKLQPFFSTIEINGELIASSQAWDTLPESKILPRDSEFVKEYVIRRYLLEEESGVIHRYKMFGTLEPYLTLFMPYDNYIKRGYTDTLSIVKQCVVSRIHYKQSRSPILRRIEGSHV